MPAHEDLDNDDYVARLLAEDAKNSSIRYASAGLSALLPARSTRPGPKPNTRFLSHLVRDVDSHNSALRRKEQLEAQTRIEGFRKSEREDERQRALDLAGTKRRGDKDHILQHRDRDSRHYRGSPSLKQERLRGLEDRRKRARRSRDDDTEHRSKRSRRYSVSDTESEHERRKHSRNSERLSDYDETHEGKKKDCGTEQDRKDSQRVRSPRRAERTSETHKDGSRGLKSHRSHSRRRSPSVSDSDPLENFVGPVPKGSHSPPVRIRGRGANKPFRSNIDTHFSSTYDPSLDVQPDPDHDSDRSDWDMALEALRDRTMWKQKQSERMREAGFNDEQIMKWERGATGTDAVQDVRDVKWKKKGEGREWDVGKKGFEDDNEDEKPGTNKGSGLGTLAQQKSVSGEDKERSREKHVLQDGWKRKDSGFLRNFRSALGS